MSHGYNNNQHNPILKAILQQVSNELLLNDEKTDANPVCFPFPSIFIIKLYIKF